MLEENVRSFATKRGEFTVRIPRGKLQDPTNTGSERTKSDRKFNIRVKQDDICLLDALAKLHGVTRAALINEILHAIMVDELMSIEDQDARVLLAHVCDQAASYDAMAQPWVYDALGPEFRFILKNALEGSDTMTGQPVEMNFPSGYKYTEEEYRSPTYLGLRERLKGATK